MSTQRKTAVQSYLSRSKPGQRNYRILSARFPLGTTGIVQAPVLGIVYDNEPTTWYWGPGPSHTNLYSGVEIVKEYPARECDYFEDFTEAEIEFHKDNPPSTELTPTGGWLAPDGTFYPGRYGAHDRLAYRICAVRWSKNEGAKYLESRGWGRVNDDGNVWRKDSKKLMPRQIDTLVDLRAAALAENTVKSRAYAQMIEESLEFAGVPVTPSVD
jgi:hypothetical protein